MNGKSSQQCLRVRAGVIVLHNNELLLIHRQKDGHFFYAFPGGGVEADETIEEAAVRELFEETSIKGTAVRCVYHMRITNVSVISSSENVVKGYKDEYLILCNYISGNPHLPIDSEEYRRSTQTKTYTPCWVSIDEIHDLLLYPLEIKELLLKDLKNGFPRDVQTLEISSSELRHT